MYLQKVVQPLINSMGKSIFVTDEIDLTSNIHIDIINHLCETFLKRLYKSSHLFPLIIRVLLSHTQKEVAKKFPEMKQRVIGSFLFLRFIVPAFVTPERYHLKGESSSSLSCKKANICISRVLQTMANGALFDESRGFSLSLFPFPPSPFSFRTSPFPFPHSLPTFSPPLPPFSIFSFLSCPLLYSLLSPKLSPPLPFLLLFLSLSLINNKPASFSFFYYLQIFPSKYLRPFPFSYICIYIYSPSFRTLLLPLS